MKQQNTVSEVLGSEHRRIDELFQQFGQLLAKGEVDGEPFNQAAQILHRHIYLEEEILFPEVSARGLVGPPQVMAQEHGEICRLLGGIQSSIESKAGPERIQEAFTALRNLLGEHNLKEEHILYPSADQLLDQDALAQVLQRLKGANPPEGWLCLAHRA